MTRLPQKSQTAVGRWWDDLALRERRLVGALGATVIVVALVAVAMVIKSGLDKRRRRNEMLREAIKSVDKGRDSFEARKRKEQELRALIGDTSPVLTSYLEDAAKKADIVIPEQTPGKSTPHGKFVEKSIDLKLRGVTLEQLANFLKNVEQSPIVVVQRLQVKTYFNQHERLDVELTVATFERAKETPKKPGKPAEAGDKENG